MVTFRFERQSNTVQTLIDLSSNRPPRSLRMRALRSLPLQFAASPLKPSHRPHAALALDAVQPAVLALTRTIAAHARIQTGQLNTTADPPTRDRSKERPQLCESGSNAKPVPTALRLNVPTRRRVHRPAIRTKLFDLDTHQKIVTVTEPSLSGSGLGTGDVPDLPTQ